jgi:carbonic anhydrase
VQEKLTELLAGYSRFRKLYASEESSVMEHLSFHGQKPEVMVIACSDSRVDPAIILQCHPGDLFVVRNVAAIIPPFEKDSGYHGTSAALEFGVRFLKVKHVILLGHSQCGGIQTLLNKSSVMESDFIHKWVSILKNAREGCESVDGCAKKALTVSYKNCLSFPWIQSAVNEQRLQIHRWFFQIRTGEILTYLQSKNDYEPLQVMSSSSTLHA